jgi:hypothetical protein
VDDVGGFVFVEQLSGGVQIAGKRCFIENLPILCRKHTTNSHLYYRRKSSLRPGAFRPEQLSVGLCRRGPNPRSQEFF